MESFEGGMALKNPVVTIKSSNSFSYLLLALQSILSLKRKSPVTLSTELVF